MGTPNVNRARLVAELTAILSQPIYRQLLDRGNEYAEMRQATSDREKSVKTKTCVRSNYTPKGPKQFAQDAVDRAFGDPKLHPNLLEPIYVAELRPVKETSCYYRVYDGIWSKTALTLGNWWCNRQLLKQICHNKVGLPKETRQVGILQDMRSRMFVHPAWNQAKDVAQMKVGVGARLPAIVGKGNWEALKNSTDIQTEEDLIEKMGMAPTPGPKQFYFPLLNDLWVCKVPKDSEKWPFD